MRGKKRLNKKLQKAKNRGKTGTTKWDDMEGAIPLVTLW